MSGFTKPFRSSNQLRRLPWAFGRKEWREQSQSYLSGLLLQCEEQRSAEKLSGMVPVKAKSMRRFLTEVRISLEKEIR